MSVLIIILAIHALVIGGLVLVLRQFRAIRSHALVWGFVLFGLLAGIFAARLWPLDTSAIANPLAVWTGDWLYVHAIEWIGDPHSDQAHFTIPWLLRVPEVYTVASSFLYGALGVVAQWLYALLKHRRNSSERSSREPAGG